jgi:hypothetical protein
MSNGDLLHLAAAANNHTSHTRDGSRRTLLSVFNGRSIMKFEKTFGAIGGEPTVTYWFTLGSMRFAFTRFE